MGINQLLQLKYHYWSVHIRVLKKRIQTKFKANKIIVMHILGIKRINYYKRIEVQRMFFRIVKFSINIMQNIFNFAFMCM
jgi:hypothetical protein